LHLVGVAVRNAAGEPAAPAGTFLALLWDALAGEFAAAGGSAPERVAEAEPAAPFVPKLIRAVAPAIPEPLRGAAPASVAEPAAALAAVEEHWGEPLDASVGTLVHAYLETIARSGPEAWNAERIAALAPAMRLWLGRQGHAADEAEQGARRAQAALVATLGSEAGRWVLLPRAGAAAELALASPGAGTIVTQVIDRTFIDNGERWIVDYKTARMEGDDAALAAHAERYRPQLERYAALFADEGRPVRMAILYAASGRLVELRNLNG
jgi:hypothetical protein